MSLAIVFTRAQTGIDSRDVIVEAHLAPGMPSLSIVGLPETAVKESKDRVRSAVQNAGFRFPAKRITVNLAPADLPKEGGRFDLPIAIGILAASGQIAASRLAECEFIGELALGGGLRPVSGVLPSVIAAGRRERGIVVPGDNAEQAGLAEQAEVYAARHLLDVTAHLDGAGQLQPVRFSAPPASVRAPDLAEVRGQGGAKRALTVAAAGGHNILMAGPPGAGKTMLAQRLPGLLPAMEIDEALECASVWSLTAQGFDIRTWRRRPFRSPHHGASAAALIGGGSHPRPGEVSLAHHGVLFLDELPEFGARTLDQLREPLETGEVHISRIKAQMRYPARFQLVAAMNLCRCGRRGDPRATCSCTDEQVGRYQARVSGPLLDRVDIKVHVKPVDPASLRTERVEESSASVRERVTRARALQLERQERCNASLAADAVDRHCVIGSEGRALLERAMERLRLSARAYHRVLKVARTIADLAGQERIATAHLAEAIQYRAFGVGR